MEVCRQWNFGLRLALTPLEVDAVRREIRGYDAGQAAAVGCFVRERCGRDEAISACERLYQEVLSGAAAAACDGDSENLKHVLLALPQSSDRCRAHEGAAVTLPMLIPC